MRYLKILIVTPAPLGSRRGNRVTARRWAGVLRALGHRVRVREHYTAERCDMLVALHAERSHESIARFADRYPNKPLLVALTGTDLYGDIQHSADAQRSLEVATHLVLLQPLGVNALPQAVRHKAVTIYQSVTPPPGPHRRSTRHFDVCVVGHLRDVKDPLRAAYACQLLPASSRIRIRHAGKALTTDYEKQAIRASRTIARYHWLGEIPRWKALRLIAGSHVLALTSITEGGANVITEALGLGTPAISTRIDGSVGLLGEDYPGYFPVGDTSALAQLLNQVETNSALYSEISNRCAELQKLAAPAQEKQRWDDLLRPLFT